MDIVIVAQYLRNIENLKENNSRFVYLAKLLCSESKNKVEIVTSDFMHGDKRKFGLIEQPKEFKITVINEPGYPRNVCLSRFYSHFILAKNIKKYLQNRRKPDCIYCAIPSLDVAKVVTDYCKTENIKFIVDIQDLWPDAFKMVFHMPVISDLIFKPMELVANQIYAQADEIVAVSQTYCERAMRVNKKCHKAHTVFLGTRLSDFDNNAQKKNDIEFDKTRLKLAYCGTLGSSYDLTCVIDALSILNSKGIESPQFIVMGDGPRKEEFERYAIEKKVDAIFTGLLDYSKMCSLLCKCDIVVNPITKGAAQSIINKHADYAASGLPVLNTQECEEYRNLVKEYDMGFNCKNNDAKDLAEKIRLLLNDEKMRLKMGKNARRCAEERFDRRNTYQILAKLVNGKSE